MYRWFHWKHTIFLTNRIAESLQARHVSEEKGSQETSIAAEVCARCNAGMPVHWWLIVKCVLAKYEWLLASQKGLGIISTVKRKNNSRQTRSTQLPVVYNQSIVQYD